MHEPFAAPRRRRSGAGDEAKLTNESSSERDILSRANGPIGRRTPVVQLCLNLLVSIRVAFALSGSHALRQLYRYAAA